MLSSLSQVPKTAFYKIADAIGGQFIVEKSIGIATCSKTEITMFGGREANLIYQRFSAPHRKFPIVGTKTLGVALSSVPEEPAGVFQGKCFHEARRKKNRALKAGFRVEKMALCKDFFDAMYTINMSAPIRQNRPVEDHLADRRRVQEFCEKNVQFYGIFNCNDELRAYAHGTLCGEVFVLHRCIGHYADLRQGIMFLLMLGVLTDMVKIRQLHSVPHWLQHDSYFVSYPGLRQFKKETGFHPYRVRWRWDNQRTITALSPSAISI
ncbi:MAG: hypothetical protein L0H63_09650 [Nitrococcus sp.]|nr:hypothetical protein [Nitrococcus sp.]